uniref:Uncharacterized protein n=1 Tax=Gibberella zeae (strain ATCC MYA-4620 / CBS 123657 / FGSC 9075 / NRRL 31084 / PH-1) TaxID=229533 RepID=A0A0A1PKL6_GIBZE
MALVTSRSTLSSKNGVDVGCMKKGKQYKVKRMKN